MSTMPTVKSVMTPFPYTIALGDTIARAQDLMAEHEIRHLPIKDEDGGLLGVLSEREVNRLLGPDGTGPGSASAFRVRDAPIQDVYVVDMAARLDEVAETMADRRLGAALVTKDGRLAGIFTVVDACRLLADSLRTQFPAGDGAA